MVSLLEILKGLAFLLTGGGLAWIINFKSKRQRQQTALAVAEYRDVDEMIKKATAKVMDLSHKLLAMNEELLKTKQLLYSAEAKHRMLSKSIEQYKERCTCGAKDLL